MRLDKLKIDRFKNLQNFSIDFDEDSQTTVLVGRNGSGKSNLLEALILIFRDLDLGEPPQFGYELCYFCRNHQIKIIAKPEIQKIKSKFLSKTRLNQLCRKASLIQKTMALKRFLTQNLNRMPVRNIFQGTFLGIIPVQATAWKSILRSTRNVFTMS